MPMNATRSAAGPRPLVFAGLPASSWTFAIRTWITVLLALYASFWLELDVPSSAAITVAILALPTRGQAMEKAGFRLLATIIGVTASIAIAGFFSQTDGLLLAVFSVSIGLCVYAAGLLDGNRAYAAALCCVTIALIAVQQIDSPQQVFPTGVARGAAIAVGVVASALVNDLLAVPDYHPVLLARLEALHRQVLSYAENATRGAVSSSVAAGLLRDIAAIRPEIASLATESSSGNARSAAARTAMVDLVTGLFLARAAAELSAAKPATQANHQDGGSSGPMATSLAWLRKALNRQNESVRGSLEALRAGVHPTHEWRAPLYRSRRIAAEAGARAAIHFALASIFFVVTGWPTTEICLSLVAIIIGLSSTAPDSRVFTTIAVVATPTACLLAGILKYLVLDTVSAFQLLAIGLVPFVIGPALLMSLPNRMLSAFGRLVLVFTLAVLAPTNPQTYDPETFLVTSLFIFLGAILPFIGQHLLPPWSNDRRLRQLLREAHSDRRGVGTERRQHLAPEEANFRDAARIEQIMAASAPAPNSQTLDEVMRCFDQTAALRLCAIGLDRLADGPLASVADTARTALAQRNASAVMASAKAFYDTAPQDGSSAGAACSALVLASALFSPDRSIGASHDAYVS
jgi:uncharacterized membrane protein YccC